MLSLVLTLFLVTSDAQAQEPASKDAATDAAATVKTNPSATSSKSKTSTSLYEDDEPQEQKKSKLESLTAKVKVVRDESDGVEVFFDGKPGAYYLYRYVENYATHLKTLEGSKKPQGLPVTIEFDAERRIKTVEKPKSASPDPNKTWDFNVPSGN